MAVDGTSIKNDIDNDLANKGFRGVRITGIITTLKKVVDWVTNAVNGNLAGWLKAGTTDPALANTDAVYHKGRVIVGRTTDSGLAPLQVEGSITAEGLLAENYAGKNPQTYAFGGYALMAYLCNLIAGSSEFSFVNTNPNSIGTVFWKMTNATTRKLLLMLRDGSVGIGTENPTEALEVVGRVKATGFVSAGALPTISKGPAVGTSGTVTLGPNSTDTCGELIITTGNNPTTVSTICGITFAQAFPRTVRVFISPGSTINAGPNVSRIWVGPGTGGFELYTGNTALDASTTIRILYFIIA